MEPLGFSLTLNTHLQPMACLLGGRVVWLQVLLSTRDWYSSFMAACHSGTERACLALVGSRCVRNTLGFREPICSLVIIWWVLRGTGLAAELSLGASVLIAGVDASVYSAGEDSLAISISEGLSQGVCCRLGLEAPVQVAVWDSLLVTYAAADWVSAFDVFGAGNSVGTWDVFGVAIVEGGLSGTLSRDDRGKVVEVVDWLVVVLEVGNSEG